MPFKVIQKYGKLKEMQLPLGVVAWNQDIIPWLKFLSLIFRNALSGAVKVFTWLMPCSKVNGFLPSKLWILWFEAAQVWRATSYGVPQWSKADPPTFLIECCASKTSAAAAWGLHVSLTNSLQRKIQIPVAAAQWPCAAQANTAIMSRSQGLPHISPMNLGNNLER